MMDPTDSLLKWARTKGVEIAGIRPHSNPASGFGMMATRNLKVWTKALLLDQLLRLIKQQKGDVLITVPTRAVRSLETVSRVIRAKIPEGITIHSLLAADLVLKPLAESWARVIPKLSDFESFPFFWPETAQDLLPTEAKLLLHRQQSSFKQDWEQLKIAFPNVQLREYTHAWFVVSTRAFYNETPQTILYPWHDRLALLPVADLFNHAATGCQVSYSSKSYTITADRDYPKGSEVCTSYGDHSNDFLLTEYGFLLQNNPSDHFTVDDLISPKASTKQAETLKEMATFGALGQSCKPGAEADNIINNKKRSESTYTTAQVLLHEILENLPEEMKVRRQKITSLDDGDGRCRTLLLERWNQIEELGQKAIRLGIANIGAKLQ